MSRAEYTIDKDLAGRVMAIEQRLKGLQGRTAAIEARLSCPDNARPRYTEDPGDDYVQAMHSTDTKATGEVAIVAMGAGSVSQGLIKDSGTKVRRSFNVDATGLIAGGILIGAGLLMYMGSFDLLKNPLVATGCGILLAGCALRRIVL